MLLESILFSFIFQDNSKLVVIGGYTSSTGIRLDQVEVIDLEDEDASCTFLAPYPVPIEYPTVAYIDGIIQVCGGRTDAGITSECYAYDFGSNSWSSSLSLTLPRGWPASCLIGEGEWFITGGDFSSTEVIQNGASEPGPRLDNGVYAACQVSINATHVFLADGADGFAYILEWDTRSWTYQVWAHLTEPNCLSLN